MVHDIVNQLIPDDYQITYTVVHDIVNYQDLAWLYTRVDRTKTVDTVIHEGWLEQDCWHGYTRGWAFYSHVESTYMMALCH